MKKLSDRNAWLILGALSLSAVPLLAQNLSTLSPNVTRQDSSARADTSSSEGLKNSGMGGFSAGTPIYLGDRHQEAGTVGDQCLPCECAAATPGGLANLPSAGAGKSQKSEDTSGCQCHCRGVVGDLGRATAPSGTGGNG